MEPPRLIECHGHVMLDGVNLGRATARHKDGVNTAIARAHLEALAKRGVVYFRDGGDNLGVSVYAKQIAHEYGIHYTTPVFAIHKEGRYGGIVGRSFNAIADYKKLIAQAQADGADFIKLMLSGILTFDVYGELSCPPLSGEEAAVLVKIAHDQGFRVMAHVNGSDTIRAALEAGTDSIEHGYFMDEQCTDLLVQAKAVWVPTLAPVAAFSKNPGKKGAVASEVLKGQMNCINRVLCKGGLVASGSDSGAYGVPHGEGIIAELKLMQEASGMEKTLFLEQVGKANERIKQLFAPPATITRRK